jgi:hypothetical protein
LELYGKYPEFTEVDVTLKKLVETGIDEAIDKIRRYAGLSRREMYASDRWKHKAVKICLVVLEASKWVRRSKNTRYTGGDEIMRFYQNQGLNFIWNKV